MEINSSAGRIPDKSLGVYEWPTKKFRFTQTYQANVKKSYSRTKY